MIRFILTSLGLLCLCLILAYLLIRRRMAIIALLVGLLILGAYQVYLHRSLEASIQACIDRACAAGGLPPGCHEAEFGCTEWSGLSVFVFYLTGLIQFVVFAVGAGVIGFFQARKNAGAAAPSDPRSSPPPT